MSTIDVFYQGEGLRDFEHTQVNADESVRSLKARIAEKHGLAILDVFLFAEDSAEPLDEAVIVGTIAVEPRLKVHMHRCRHVDVSVTFAGRTVSRRFGPGTTIAHIKHWAAENEFKMSKEDASEHLLQVAGSHVRPAPGTHIGTLVSSPGCKIAFDLVADQRVNGSECFE
jgi:hypothetical protein